jgi:exodeoxyribonuclease-3
MTAGRTKIVSWNVNGIRAVLSRGSLGPVEAEAPDVLCLQETRASREQVEDTVLPRLKHQYWYASETKKGYAGTAILSRREPLSVRYGLGRKEHDGEGRLITVELPDYYVVTVYTPNAQRGLARLDYRLRWDRAFLAYLKRLDVLKPVIFCGDLNVAHEEIDLAHPESNHKNAGFTDEERASFTRLLRAGFADTFREQHPGEVGHYSWWSVPQNARARNVGWRIDYVCASRRLAPKVRETFIRSKIMGSDHCPVGIVLEEDG